MKEQLREALEEFTKSPSDGKRWMMQLKGRQPGEIVMAHKAPDGTVTLSGHFQKPSVCRMVLYRAHGSPNGQYPSVHRPAVITEVKDDGTTCSLAVFNPTGMFFNVCEFDETGEKPGCWSWPSRS